MVTPILPVRWSATAILELATPGSTPAARITSSLGMACRFSSRSFFSCTRRHGHHSSHSRDNEKQGIILLTFT